MRKPLIILAAISVFSLASPIVIAQDSGEGSTAENEGGNADTPATLTKGEERLAKLLKGRAAGTPESCIRMWPNTDLTIIDDTALVYKVGSTLWVNFTRNPGDIDDRDTLTSRRTTSRLCRTDILNRIDYPTGTFRGSIQLLDFVPYKRVKDDDETINPA